MRKFALPPEIAELSNEQIAQLDSWLDRFTYAKTQQLFLATFGKQIGRMKLARYRANRDKARLLTQPSQPALTAADLVAIQNGTPLPALDKRLLQLRALQLSQTTIESPAALKQLFDIFTYEERRSMAEHRLKIEEHAAQIRSRRTELRNRQLNLQERPQNIIEPKPQHPPKSERIND